MGLRDKVKASAGNVVYTRPWQLPTFVAFIITFAEQVPNPNKGEKGAPDVSNRMKVRFNGSVELLVYLTGKFLKFDPQDWAEMNSDIKSEKPWYLVSQGGIANDAITLDVLTEEERSEANIRLFNCESDQIRKCDRFGNPIPDSSSNLTSPSKPSTSSDNESPSKKFRYK